MANRIVNLSSLGRLTCLLKLFPGSAGNRRVEFTDGDDAALRVCGLLVPEGDIDQTGRAGKNFDPCLRGFESHRISVNDDLIDCRRQTLEFKLSAIIREYRALNAAIGLQSDLRALIKHRTPRQEHLAVNTAALGHGY